MKISSSADLGQITGEENITRFMTQFLTQVRDVVNGNISFRDNMKSAIVSVPFSAANMSTAVSHGLGVVPVGYVKIRGPNIQVFDATDPFTKENIYVQASGVGTVTLLVLA